MTYYFSMGGLVLKLDAHRPLSVSPRFRPFLCREQLPDYTIIIKPAQSLPAARPDAVTRGGMQTVWEGGAESVFYTDKAGEAPCMLCRLDESTATLSCLPEAAHTLSDVGDVFHRVPMESWLLRKKALLLHAALVNWRGKGILLCGPSGVGKSTQAALWQQLGGSVLNGDRTLLGKADQWLAWGSPVAGTSGIHKNEGVPVAAIAVLRQGETPEAETLSPAEAMKYLYPETAIHHWDRQFAEQATDILLSLACEVPVYRLTCTRGVETPELLRKKANL